MPAKARPSRSTAHSPRPPSPTACPTSPVCSGTTAQAELIHAEGHLKALEGVGKTAENLEAAIGGETYEFTEMYPPMLEQAKADSHPAKRMFAFAVKAEAVHAKLYALALEAAAKGEDLAETNFYLCPVCGHIEFGEPPEKCPICGVPAAKYVQV